jgi:hypothetical protein
MVNLNEMCRKYLYPPFDFAPLRSGRAVQCPFVLSVTHRVKSKHERRSQQMI